MVNRVGGKGEGELLKPSLDCFDDAVMSSVGFPPSAESLIFH
jgi:hypothetical protein